MLVETLSSKPPNSVLILTREPVITPESRQRFAQAGFWLVSAASWSEARTLAAKTADTRPVVSVFIDANLLQTGNADFTALIQKLPGATFLRLVPIGHPERSTASDCIPTPRAAEELLPFCRMARETFQLKVKYGVVASGDAAGQTRPGSSDRAALERAAMVRLSTYMGRAIADAPSSVLESALGFDASSEALTRVLADALVRPAADGEWAAALLRGAEVQRDLLAQAGGALSAADVGKVLGIKRAAVDKRRRQGALLGIKLPSGDIAYPAAQFHKGDVVPGLPEVLQAFHIRDPWMQLDTLLAADETLGGRSAFEALAKGEVEGVKASVSSYGEQGL